MSVEELRALILGDGFKQDLTEISSYLASIKQERPIIHALAKQLWKGGIQFQIEATRKDLFVAERHIEFKFTYDSDLECLKGENGELIRHEDLKAIYDAIQAKQRKKHGWNQSIGIYEDVCVKHPHMFVWIICSRDLSRLSKDDKTRICVWKWQEKYNKSHPYMDVEYLEVADKLVAKLKEYKEFSVLKEKIVTNGDFPSTYHFWIFELSQTNGVN